MQKKNTVKTKYDWQLNASTGDYIADIDALTRVIRLKGGGLYEAQFWGNYSFDYPIYSGLFKTPAAAVADLRKVMTAEEHALLTSK